MTSAKTDKNGYVTFELDAGEYNVSVEALGMTQHFTDIGVTECGCSEHDLCVPIGFGIEFVHCRDDTALAGCPGLIEAGTPIKIVAKPTSQEFAQALATTGELQGGSGFPKRVIDIRTDRGLVTRTAEGEAILETGGLEGSLNVSARYREEDGPSMEASRSVRVAPKPTQPISGDVSVTLRRSAMTETADMPLWTVIRAATSAISFDNYKKFMDDVLCNRDARREFEGPDSKHCSMALPFPGVETYSLVKCATEIFLMTHCGVADFDLDTETLREEQLRYGRKINRDDLRALWNDGYLVEVNGGIKTLPYLALIRSRLGEVPLKDDTGNGFNRAEVANCFGLLRSKLESPCLLELIWSYWHEEGMLVQTMKAIGMRFQNRRSSERDPMMRFDIDPLRPLGNLLWGYIQDEQHRLTITRRAYTYDQEYGLNLVGRAAPRLRAADSRSKFLEAFHNLLQLCSIFFKSDDDTTVIADGFPIINAIREVHLLLAEGAHNQFGDLPSTARQEMLIEQWLLARPEMREFLGGRIMVPYSEVWMDRVDTVKRIQGWTDTTITDFHDLAVFGEQLLLSIRWGHWTKVHDPANAANWARYWRSEIQSYIHSYRAVTGVDLTAEARQSADRFVQPSVHLRRRLDQQLAKR
ncbi:MAG TPA: carboxypeptidase-like regulatory domain-containing protein [Chthoniobacterales bacterium]|nr:carboxypeptidase-like regulatory domain-containing protein [Chthoniobacterales bacterium]